MARETERFQAFCRKYVNRKVRNHFKDLGGDGWIPDFAIDRHMTRWVCTHQDKDPLMLTVGRLLIYFFKIQGLLEEPIYAIPSTQLHESVTIYPQVIICFKESSPEAKANKRYPLKATHSIRIKSDFSSKAEVERLARKIKAIFGTPVFKFTKGKIKYTYYDKSKGYSIIVTCPNESEAKSVIEKLLEINSDRPDWDCLTDSNSRKNYNTQKTTRVAGRIINQVKRRQSGVVHFTHAELSVPDVPENVQLVDVSGQYPGAILYG